MWKKNPSQVHKKKTFLLFLKINNRKKADEDYENKRPALVCLPVHLMKHRGSNNNNNNINRILRSRYHLTPLFFIAYIFFYVYGMESREENIFLQFCIFFAFEYRSESTKVLPPSNIFIFTPHIYVHLWYAMWPLNHSNSLVFMYKREMVCRWRKLLPTHKKKTCL